MKLETRIELIGLIILAVIVGGWIGIRLALSPERPQEEASALKRSGRSAAVKPAKVAPRPAMPKARVDPAVPSRTEVAQPKSLPKPNPIVTAKTTPKQKPRKAAEPTKTKKPEALSTKPRQTTDAEFDKAKSLYESGKPFEARGLLTRIILATPEGKKREEVRKCLDLINRKLFFSRAPSPDCTYHKVERGDNLAAIAKSAGKDYYFSHLIMLVNGIKEPRKLRIGKKLKIPQGKFSALVQKRAYRLIVFFSGHYIKEYPIAVGAPASPTPVGEFVVGVKQAEPTWTTPEGEVHKFGHPKNILGTRWIGFVETRERDGYGIHGTAEPNTIGKNISNGCVRMHNRDVEEVFGMLMSGDLVKIVR